jgi:hypothetical protein
MNIVITTIENTGVISLPITLFFWGYVVAYIIHIIDESLLGETFVTMVRRNFWPGYEWKHFFGFNTLLMSLIILSNILYEIFGGSLIVLPLIFVFLLTTNGVWHLLATIIQKKYSPGLATSIIYWILFYFIFRYSILSGQIMPSISLWAGIIGTLLTILMIGSFFIFKKRFK